MTEKIINSILSELKTYGVRWLNGDDLTAVNGVVHANMAIDLTESRLEVVCREDYLSIHFGTDRNVYDKLMRNKVLKPFINVNDTINISFSLYHKKGKSYYSIGKNKKRFSEVTNYTIHDVNVAGVTSSKNGDCGWKSIEEIELVNQYKDIVSFFYKEFENNNFYKEWEYSEEKIRRGLRMLKSL
jgi:hypothetical protein|tara:strand:- start:345 stop:899 length:555 start_codon:yes stop_codon:yes gene_type:complete